MIFKTSLTQQNVQQFNSGVTIVSFDKKNKKKKENRKN